MPDHRIKTLAEALMKAELGPLIKKGASWDDYDWNDWSEDAKTVLADMDEDDGCLAYAQDLALTLCKKHYPGAWDDFQIESDMQGVLSQIDNMTAELAKPRLIGHIRQGVAEAIDGYRVANASNGHLISDTDVMGLTDVVMSVFTGEPHIDPKIEAAAERAYSMWAGNDPHVHANRMATWAELDESDRDRWRKTVGAVNDG